MADTAIAPSSTGSSLDLSKALTFFFEDPNWVPKLVVGTLFALLTPFVIGAVFLAGYAITLARHTMHRAGPTLPEWDDLPGILVDGLKGLAITVAHKLPLIVLSVLMVVATAGSALLERQSDTIPDGLLYYGLPAIVGGSFLLFVLWIAVAVYLPAAFVRFIQTDRLGAAFEVMENFAFIRKHLSTYVSALVAIALAGLIGQLGVMVFCIGVFPAMFWSACVVGHVVGELARLDRGARPTQS
jgi:hypothetical protein